MSAPPVPDKAVAEARRAAFQAKVEREIPQLAGRIGVVDSSSQRRDQILGPAMRFVKTVRPEPENPAARPGWARLMHRVEEYLKSNLPAPDGHGLSLSRGADNAPALGLVIADFSGQKSRHWGGLHHGPLSEEFSPPDMRTGFDGTIEAEHELGHVLFNLDSRMRPAAAVMGYDRPGLANAFEETVVETRAALMHMRDHGPDSPDLERRIQTRALNTIIGTRNPAHTADNGGVLRYAFLGEGMVAARDMVRADPGGLEKLSPLDLLHVSAQVAARTLPPDGAAWDATARGVADIRFTTSLAETMARITRSAEADLAAGTDHPAGSASRLRARFYNALDASIRLDGTGHAQLETLDVPQRLGLKAGLLLKPNMWPDSPMLPGYAYIAAVAQMAPGAQASSLQMRQSGPHHDRQTRIIPSSARS